MQQTKKLASARFKTAKLKELKTFFEQEMDGFYNLVWSIGIDTSLANQYQLKVYCPAFKDKSSIDKLIDEKSVLKITTISIR